MTITVKKSADLVIPPSVRRRAGFKSGEELEVKVCGGIVSLMSKRPPADDDYTPAQRRVIEARLLESEGDLKKGRVHGPFETHGAMMAFLEDDLARHRRTVPRKRAKK